MAIFNVNSHRSPFVVSPFYKSLSKNFKNPKYSHLVDKLNQDGYCIYNPMIDEALIDKANNDLQTIVESKQFKTNAAEYHYNDSPRIVEAWKDSKSIKSLATNKNILELLTYAYNSRAIPFSTINFLKGTEQPLHSDEFHFGSIPHGYLTGVWLALEDIHPDSGPLSIVEKSHKLPLFSFEMIGLDVPKSKNQLKEFNAVYEDWVRQIIIDNDLKVLTPKLKKGECLIWLSNTLHGSFEITNKELTRKSLVTHFHYEACEQIFFPSYSNIEKGNYIPRSLNGLDITKN